MTTLRPLALGTISWPAICSAVLLILYAAQAWSYAQDAFIDELSPCEALAIGAAPRLVSKLETLQEGYRSDLSGYKESARKEVVRIRRATQIKLGAAYEILVGDDAAYATRMQRLVAQYSESSEPLPLEPTELASLIWIATLHERDVPVSLISGVIDSQRVEPAIDGGNAVLVLATGIYVSTVLGEAEIASFIQSLPAVTDSERFVLGFLTFYNGAQYNDPSQLEDAADMLEQLISGPDTGFCDAELGGVVAYVAAKARLMLAQLAKADAQARLRRDFLRSSSIHLAQARSLIERARKELDPIRTPKLWANAYRVSGDVYNELLLDFHRANALVRHLTRLRDRSYELGRMY